MDPQGARLVRVNLSQGTSFEDLMGRRLLQEDQAVFLPGPFAEAFLQGHWLLLVGLPLRVGTAWSAGALWVP